MGIQGSGKGTQAEKLVEEFGFTFKVWVGSRLYTSNESESYSIVSLKGSVNLLSRKGRHSLDRLFELSHSLLKSNQNPIKVCSHALLTRAPLYSPRRAFSFDLHVLGTPPAFVLSQDQTLTFKS